MLRFVEYLKSEPGKISLANLKKVVTAIDQLPAVATAVTEPTTSGVRFIGTEQVGIGTLHVRPSVARVGSNGEVDNSPSDNNSSGNLSSLSSVPHEDSDHNKENESDEIVTDSLIRPDTSREKFNSHLHISQSR